VKIRSLDTIAALRELAENMRNSAPEAREVAEKLPVKKEAGLQEQLKATLRGEADKFEQIAKDLDEIADEAARYRAFTTARYLLGPLATLPEEKRLPQVKAIRNAPAFMEFTATLSVPHDCTATVRLVPFFDELDDERWAVHYSNTDGDEGISDNVQQEDAEWRYWEIAGPLGQERTE
jgi:hypothetical protein